MEQGNFSFCWQIVFYFFTKEKGSTISTETESSSTQCAINIKTGLNFRFVSKGLVCFVGLGIVEGAHKVGFISKENYKLGTGPPR